MKNNIKRWKRVSLVSLMLVAAMLYGSLIGGFSKTCRFTDVPDSHWAAADIEALAVGGLVGGYGNGRFGPENPLNVDHVATIICNATGHSLETDSDYWAYEAIRHCRDDLKCMPDKGPITEANYGVSCTREQAISMLILGICTAKPTDEAIAEWTAEDIPDYAQIEPEHAEHVLTAYRLGIIYGIDERHTFNPKGTFTRAHICVILNRAGYNKKIEPPKSEYAVGMSAAAIYEEVKSWGGWREFAPIANGPKTLTAIDPIHGAIEVIINNNNIVKVLMPEANSSAWVINGRWVDAYGKPVPQSVLTNGNRDANGKFVLSSGWSYEARQLVKDILAVAYPESTDEAYQAALDVMKQEIWEVPEDRLPSAVRWLDSRGFRIGLDAGSHNMCIVIYPYNEREYIDEWLSGQDKQNSFYPSINGSYRDFPEMYELERG